MRDLFTTIGTRYLIAILNLALIFINAKVLGVEGVGLVGLILAIVGIATMFCGILAGNTIVYFMNRYSMQAVFLPSYCWTPAGAGIACGSMAILGVLPEGHALDIYILSTLTSLVAANSRFLLGKNQIFGFNLTFVLQGGLLFFVLLFLYYGLKIQNVTAYLWGMYFTNGIAFLVSLFLLLPFLNKKEADPRKGRSQYALLKEMFAYGLWGSADNIAEILTTRLNYFLIQRFAGLGSVGLLDAGTKISESVWHINRSIGFITYSRVARTHKPGEQKQITLRFFKLTFCAITLATGCILLIPEWIYTDYQCRVRRDAQRHNRVVGRNHSTGLQQHTMPIFYRKRQNTLQHGQFFCRFDKPACFGLPADPALRSVRIGHQFQYRIQHHAGILHDYFLQENRNSPKGLSDQ